MTVSYYCAPNQFGGISEYALFNGRTYYHFKNGYYKRTNRPYTLLHHDIWKHDGRSIPPGYELHHRDHNKKNNTIENYKLLTKAGHAALHQAENSPKEVVCDGCGNTFQTVAMHNKTRFCSICIVSHEKQRKAAWSHEHRDRLNDKSLTYYHENQEDRTCVMCGATFTTYKYGPQKTCGKKCASNYGRTVHPRTPKLCTVSDCARSYYAKGYCASHYKKFLKQP